MRSHLVVTLVHPPLATLELGFVREVFGGEAPAGASGWYECATAALAPGAIDAPGGMSMWVGNGLDLFERAATLVIPAWRPDEPVAPAIVGALRAAAARGARIVSIGTGAFALAAAGLLDGRRATTHWADAETLAARHPRIRVEADTLYVDEGDVVTGAGRAAGLDMLLHLVRRDHGAGVANALARRLVAPPCRAGEQVQCARRPVPHARDTRLARVIDHLRANAARPQRTPDLAAMAAMSERSFNRKFRDMFGHSPYDWLLRERVAIARELLEESSLSIDQIGAESGFGSTQAFRNAFRNVVGVNPASYRRRSELPRPRPIR